MTRYYSTQRPIAPGTFPRRDGKEAIVNFDDRVFCEEIGREAWGYIEYNQPITAEEAKAYELVKAVPKVLYFEGAGWSGADISKATIGNCRIRTAFHLDDGRAVYLEIEGSERTKYKPQRFYKWRYTGFVTHCHYITDDTPSDDCNRHRICLSDEQRVFEYTEAAILKFVNSLGASFDAIKVVPDLGGYRVFPAEHRCGPDGYYYGDEFQFDPELHKRREAVHQHYYEVERAEGKKYPNFSLWVVEGDPGALHLLRHFPGTIKTAHNKHWLIRVDTGDTLEEWIATAQETHLGRYGC